MSIRTNSDKANSNKGFSLIELLVVVAIIGVLAAVGVVGYQGYIDNTKKSVTASNAKAVHQWLLNTRTVRAANIDVKPVACGLRLTAFVAADCFSSAVKGLANKTDGPFASFKNPYDNSQKGSDAITAVTGSSSRPVAAATCATSGPGDVTIYYDKLTLPMTLEVWYCDGDDKYAQQDDTVVVWDY